MSETIAYHETGHFMALYALGLYPEFVSTTIEQSNNSEGPVTLGLTTRTGESLQKYAMDLAEVAQQLVQNPEAMPKFEELKHKSKDICLPHLAFFFGGGAMDYYKNREDEKRNRIDSDAIKAYVLPAMFVTTIDNKGIDELKSMFYEYLSKVFTAYESLSTKVCEELLQQKTITKDVMDKIVAEWESSNDTNKIKDNLKANFDVLLKKYHSWCKNH